MQKKKVEIVLQSCTISLLLLSCLTNSWTDTSSALAIAMRASRLGWVVLVTHLEIVAGSLPNLLDSHLLFKSRSARTTLIRFNFAMMEFCCLSVNLKKKNDIIA